MTAVYHQIAHSLRDAIEKKIYRIGDRLPSERELSDTYDVSRMTLRQAISLLVEEGLLERRKGSGTYVASRRVQEKMTGTTSFTDIILKEGKIPSSKLLSYTRTRANKKESEALGIMIGDPVIRMERVRYADRVPVVYELATIPYQLIAYLSQEDITQHFFKALTDSGHRIGKSSRTLSAKVADDDVAKLLDITKSDALIALKQISYLADGHAFEWVRSLYVSNRFEFYFETV